MATACPRCGHLEPDSAAELLVGGVITDAQHGARTLGNAHKYTDLDFTASLLSSLTTRNHADLQNILTDQHHPQLHEAAHVSGAGDAFLATDVLEAIVKRLQESGGPTTLAIGAVADGQQLQRSGATIVGVAPGGAGALALSNRVLTADFTVPANQSAYVAGELEISSGFVLEIAAGGVMEIG